jgi:DNA-binding transcriptional MerR regulator
MGIKFNTIEKKYYVTNDVSEMLNVPGDTIRFYTNQFDWIAIKRTYKDERRFTRKTIEQMMVVVFLLKVGGLTLAGVKRANRLNYLDAIFKLTQARQGTYVDRKVLTAKHPFKMEHIFPDESTK